MAVLYVGKESHQKCVFCSKFWDNGDCLLDDPLSDPSLIDQLRAAGYSVTKITRPADYDASRSDDFLPTAEYVVVMPNGVVRRVVSLDDLGCP